MIYPFIGFALGLLVGFKLPITVPVIYAPYVSISILAALDSVLGGIRAMEENNFDTSIFVSGFFINTLMAGFLAYFGDRLGIQLYLAAIFAFGVRIFQNLAIIRRSIIKRLFSKNNQK
ncbi:MAG: small basic family protein [Tepidanaerobacter acetatoxydans]|jgi:small basic protein|uniref:small basic family protein n=1 Tax=Tepidanaerobacter acetatoxydans TaxID=499229 RepID=UPI00350E427C|nr:small basic family protein [Tepidanaerobacter acetatoxydans]